MNVVVSGFGETGGGGLLRLDPAGGFERLDPVASTGLWVGDGWLARLCRVPAESTGIAELTVFDGVGVSTYLRLDQVPDPHDVWWDGECWVVTSSDRNAVTWIDAAGRTVREWRPTDVPDAWHVNCVLAHDGRLHVAAFGRFTESRAWSPAEAARGAGFVFDLEREVDVLSGLTHPHTPRVIDGDWVVCDSLLGELVAFDEQGQERQRVQVGGYTRGVVADGDHLHVGASGRRGGDQEHAELVTLDRGSWEEIGRVRLPCLEVYDLVLVDDRLLAGLRRGWDTNALRVDPQLESPPHPSGELRATVEVAVPSTWPAVDGFAEVSCRVVNRGTARLVTAPPNPVHLAYRWLGDGVIDEGHRTVLPRPLEPGDGLDLLLRLGGPPAPGRWTLAVSLVQEGVAWFDDLDAGSGWRSPEIDTER